MPKKMSQNKSWFLEETQTADLGDERLNKRFANILEMLNRGPNESIPTVSKGWDETKSAYRFLDNEAVSFEKVLKPHRDATEKRIKNEKVILLPQDTTELDYSSKKQTEGLGKLNYENQLGVHLHTTLAVTPDRRCLGIVNAEILVREELGHRRKRIRLPIEKKESMRWLNSYRAAMEIADKYPNTHIISMADREGDIYNIFAEYQKTRGANRADWIIRASQNRRLSEAADENKKNQEKLFQKINEAEIIGMIEFNLPKRKNGSVRKVTQEIRVLTVNLKAPYGRDGKLPSVSINIVFAKEVNPPQGAKPIEWVLLTSLSITTKEAALKVIEWYLCRWQIEIFFKILKVGCEVEELQLKTLERIKPCLALYMIIAWRILYIMMLGRSYSKMHCNVVFDEEEWRAVYIVVYREPPPKRPPNLDQMVKMVASLGGFLNRKGDGYPGPKSIWIGLQRARDFVIAMEAQNASKQI